MPGLKLLGKIDHINKTEGDAARQNLKKAEDAYMAARTPIYNKHFNDARTELGYKGRLTGWELTQVKAAAKIRTDADETPELLAAANNLQRAQHAVDAVEGKIRAVERRSRGSNPVVSVEQD